MSTPCNTCTGHRSAAATALAGRACLLLACLLLSACEPAASPAAPAASTAPTAHAEQERDKALLRAIEAPQDKARALEADLLKAQQRTDAALDEAEGKGD